MRDRLIKLLNQKQKYGTIPIVSQMDDRVCAYKEIKNEEIADCLLADGWIRPPCKVGDKVYIIRNGRINEVWVRHTNWNEVSGMADTFTFTVFYKSSPTSFTETLKFGKSEIGINVFLTKEEAKAVLRKEDERK